jgi:uncharacterized protein YeaO (DUF488 family)
VAEMNLFVMSAYETDAETFFTSIRNHHIDLVVDVRRRNTSQLCGFTRQKDLPYFLKELTGADYIHDLNLVPSEELLEAYLKKQIDVNSYFQQYLKEMEQKDIRTYFQKQYSMYRNICLLGTSVRKRRSHAEALKDWLDQM